VQKTFKKGLLTKFLVRLSALRITIETLYHYRISS